SEALRQISWTSDARYCLIEEVPFCRPRSNSINSHRRPVSTFKEHKKSRPPKETAVVNNE
ncbi:MAG: hypothetical protein KJ900_04475, partial [Proteobacteria bacterium]|nr:hypothetical protein [Pseudomonadota bacterium]MBU4027443.1 hypothetical protein [Pseudomonadota bacterium]MBU4042140.1 hypothetical protein [Pseudomonadota bacterium]MBU4169533.1 hypothetical protein [Pseudomonadota bacterium]